MTDTPNRSTTATTARRRTCRNFTIHLLKCAFSQPKIDTVNTCSVKIGRFIVITVFFLNSQNIYATF